MLLTDSAHAALRTEIAHQDLKKSKQSFDLMRNRRSGPDHSPCPLQGQASGRKISGNIIVGYNGVVRHMHETVIITDPRILPCWTETDLRTYSLHQSDAPLGLT